MILNFLKDKFTKDSIVYIAGSLSVGALGYAFHFLVSRKLSVFEYGQLQTLLALYAILAVFASTLSYITIKYSSVFAASKDYAATREFTGFIRKRAEQGIVIAFIASIVVLPFVYLFLGSGAFFGILFIILANFLGIILTIYLGVLNGWEEFFSSNSIQLAGALCKLLFGFFFAVLFKNAVMVAFSFIISAGIALAIAQHSAKKNIFEKATFASTKSWGSYMPLHTITKQAMPTFMFSLFFMILLNVDVLLVNILTNPTNTGYYAASSLLASMIFLVNAAVISVVLPKACREWHENKKITPKTIVSAYLFVCIVCLLAIAAFTLFPSFVVNLLFGARYAIIIGNLWFFGLMSLALSLLSLEVNFSYAKHDFRMIYILALTVFVMISGILLFHGSIAHIITAVIAAFSTGYFATLAMNAFAPKKEFLAHDQNITTQIVVGE